MPNRDPEAYRSATGPAPVVLRYWVLRPGYRLVLCVGLAIIGLVTVALSHRVTFHCARTGQPDAQCTWHDDGLFIAGKVSRARIGDIAGAEVQDRGATSVRLLYRRSPDGQQAGDTLSYVGEAWLAEDKHRMVNAINAFLGDPEAAELDASYGSRWANGAVALAMTFLALVLGLWVSRWEVVVVIDRVARELRFESQRPLLGGRARTVSLATLAGFGVGPRNQLLLRYEGGAEESLPAVFHPFGNDAPRVAASLDAAIRAAKRAG